MVALGFFSPKILGGGKDLQMVLLHSMNVGSVVGILQPYHMQKNLFELFWSHSEHVHLRHLSRARATIVELSQHLIVSIRVIY